MTNAEVVYQTVTWLELHLRDELAVPMVARKAGYSLHHFIRLFGGVIGTPPGEYIARRKLSEAARALASGGGRVTDIAFEYGFKDLETFSRAFRRELGTTPTAVRRGEKYLYFASAAGPRRTTTDGSVTLRSPVLEAISPFSLVGWSIRVDGPTDAVGKLWARFATRAPSIPRAVLPQRFHQLAWWSEDAEDSVEIMVGVVVSDLSDVPIDLVAKTVPACSCLVFTHRGSMASIGESYRAIYRTWLPSSDRKPVLPFNFERYIEGAGDPYSEGYSMEICVPVC